MPLDGRMVAANETREADAPFDDHRVVSRGPGGGPESPLL